MTRPKEPDFAYDWLMGCSSVPHNEAVQKNIAKISRRQEALARRKHTSAEQLRYSADVAYLLNAIMELTEELTEYQGLFGGEEAPDNEQ